MDCFFIYDVLKKDTFNKNQMSSAKRIVSIVGATGAQGGSVIRVLYQTKKYILRAITRAPNSDKASKLQKELLGIEIVKTNLTDPQIINKCIS